ncbi:MAG: HEAT repeat domain-containing protein [Planctomycetota bacterium]
MKLTSSRVVLLLGAALSSPTHGAAQDPAQTLVAFEAEQKQARLRFEHDALIERARALVAAAKGTEVETVAQARLVTISLEAELLRRLRPMSELRQTPLADTLGSLQALPLSGQDCLTLATFASLADRHDAAEAALAMARERDASLKDATDRALAALRHESVPKGGYHRHRGEWMALEVRDRARALDDALDSLAEVAALADVKMPAAVRHDSSNEAAFAALGERGPAALRAAATALQASLNRRYDSVRGWSASYANPRARADLLELDQRARTLAKTMRDRIATYDKPQQGEVDAMRAELTAATVPLDKAREKDRRGFAAVTATDAARQRDEMAAMEEALRRIDVALAARGQPGLEPVAVSPAADAETSRGRILPGRTHSALEDSQWFLLGARTGACGETIARADELLRHADQLTAWERLLVEDLRDDAIATFGREVAATSLDVDERAFLETLNEYRRLLRLRALEPDERLVRSSRKHCEEMVRLGYFGHVSPVAERRTPTLRAKLEGFAGGVGENCLAGAVDGRGAFEGWYHSPGHHRNMVGAGPLLGVGATQDHGMWTMVIGGGDGSWRVAHRDAAPQVRADLAKQVTYLAAELKRPRRDRKSLVLPDDPAVLPELLRAAFPPCYEKNPNERTLAGELLRLAVAQAPLPEQRPLLEVAATTAKERLDLDLTLPVLAEVEKNVAPQPPTSIPGRGDGPSLKAPLKLLSKSERARLARQYGGGPRTERAVEHGLQFLARCQDVDGAWRARSFADVVPGLADARNVDRGNAEWELAMTGLAILCYVTTGSSSQQGEYATQVDRGTRFLMSKLLDYGRFETAASHYMYSHALATQALCEVYAYTADPIVGTYAQLAVDYLVAAQHRPSGGWRYEPNQSGDTSVVGWVVMALNSAHKAHLEVGGFRDALRFLDAVTEKQYYRVGYTGPADNAIFGNRLAAVAVTSRRFLGQDTGDPRMHWPALRMLEDPPRADRADYYYWYYGTLANFQMGGEFWRAWSEALVPALLSLHVEKEGQPIDGSFNRDRHYSGTGGRLFSTAMAILCATAWYRYDRAPKPKLRPFTGDIDRAMEPYLAVLRDPPDDRTQRLTEAKFADEFGPYGVPVLLRALAAEKTAKTQKRLAALVEQVAEPMNEGALLLHIGKVTDADARKAVMRALERCCSLRSRTALVAALADEPDAQVRALVARTLGKIGSPEVVEALQQRLEVERAADAKQQIQNALRRIASQSALDRLVAEAIGKQAGRAAVLSALEILERDQLADRIAELAATQPKLHRRIVELVGKEREQAPLPVLIALLEADAEAVRGSAFGLLAALTQQRFGYEPGQDAGARAEAVKRFWTYWDTEQQRYGGSKDKRGKR